MKKIYHIISFLIILIALLISESSLAMNNEQSTCAQAVIHYHRRDADYQDWGLHTWGSGQNQTTWDSPLIPAGEDDFGIYWIVEMLDEAQFLNYIIHKGDTKDPGPDQLLDFTEVGCEIWQLQDRPEQFTDAQSALEEFNMQVSNSPEPEEDQVIIHYRRRLDDYDGWGLHVWGPTTEENITWTSPLLPAGQDEFGLYWVINMEPGAEVLNYIVHNGDNKDPGPDQQLVFAENGREIWLIEGSGEQFMDPEEAVQGMIIAGIGDITNKAQAHWIDQSVIAWPIEYGDKAIYLLHYDPDGNIEVNEDGLVGGQTIQLEFVGDNLSSQYHDRYPHLSTAIELRVPEEFRASIPELLKGQLAISVSLETGEILTATGVQMPGVIDALYANDETLGVNYQIDGITLSLWAPTAKSVNLLLYPDADSSSPAETLPMSLNPETGIWSTSVAMDWDRKYYQYQIDVFVRQEGQVVTNIVTDPYSLNLSMNSGKSQILNLSDANLQPEGWLEFSKPVLDNFSDIVIYELHIRDFSILDDSVPEEHRGTYLAFTENNSLGMKHLSQLAESGLTHLHLLPSFDIATINEDKTEWAKFDRDALTGLPADSPVPQEKVAEVRGLDGYNWGYDPYHYGVPEGSYSTNLNSEARVVEFRQMVQAVNNTGLRVVMDVVYNHTNASGQTEKSVLDRIVPGYYHRLDENGNVTNSTCCANTATEHAMMRKLMNDTLIQWARDYKIDGFRFDLMGHHMKEEMMQVLSALRSLTMENDGVDGSKIYIYGEGWDFGEVENNARGVNASQLNLSGTGIGSFNDRFRDAVRGGSPFSDKQDQGYITGQYYFPNKNNSQAENSQLTTLLHLKDLIRIGMVGNLATYEFESADGTLVTGSDLLYNEDPAGYTISPIENILYISAHDNETLFDAIQFKLPQDATMEQRLRAQNLGVSLTMFGQGIPFFHAGSDILRSKSLDRDSYDSGDWFNAIDWTYQSNNWGIGLPPEDKNGSVWPLMAEILTNPNIQPDEDYIDSAREYFLELLKIRKSSPLFRLEDEETIRNQVSFHNTGADQIPGLIAMAITDNGEIRLDDEYDLILLFFNADVDTVEFALPSDIPVDIELHPLQIGSIDSRISDSIYDANTGTIRLPAQSTVVMVHRNPSTVSSEEVESIEETSQVASDENARDPSAGEQEENFNSRWLVPVILGIVFVIFTVIAFYIRRKGLSLL